jgi:hypothetical protein
MSIETTVLGDWIPEPIFAEKLREELGYGSEATLKRWRRLNKIPQGYEWKHIGRMPVWRPKKDE